MEEVIQRRFTNALTLSPRNPAFSQPLNLDDGKPSLRRIGRVEEDDLLRAADEHLATGTVVLAAVAVDELHVLGDGGAVEERVATVLTAADSDSCGSLLGESGAHC